MGKNILIFSDGTGQAGGQRPDQRLSNIYKLYRATRTGPDSAIDPRDQVAYYDPGLGTVTTSGSIRFSAWEAVKSVAGLAVGLGFNGNVIDCYEAILRHYEPGDRIYLFGFSRGGYTVRAVANVLRLCGVPSRDVGGAALPRAGRRVREIAKEAVVKVYGHGAGHPRDAFEDERQALAYAFRQKYAAGNDPSQGDVYPEFIGVFDAVAALGLTGPERLLVFSLATVVALVVAASLGGVAQALFGWNWLSVASATAGAAIVSAALAFVFATARYSPSVIRTRRWPWHLALWRGKHFDRDLDSRIPRARHALAIDERRSKFHRVAWGHPGTPNVADVGTGKSPFEQMWFAGNHSDIGGSYPEEESRLSDIALSWMLEEATSHRHPVLVDASKLNLFPYVDGIQHCEQFAFSQAFPVLARVGIGWASSAREIPSDAPLHTSVLERLALSSVRNCDENAPYRPLALRSHALAKGYY